MTFFWILAGGWVGGWGYDLFLGYSGGGVLIGCTIGMHGGQRSMYFLYTDY